MLNKNCSLSGKIFGPLKWYTYGNFFGDRGGEVAKNNSLQKKNFRHRRSLGPPKNEGLATPLMSDILKHVLLLNKNTDLLASFTSLVPDEMAPSLKKHFRLALGAKLLTGCCCPSFSVVGVLNTFM